MPRFHSRFPALAAAGVLAVAAAGCHRDPTAADGAARLREAFPDGGNSDAVRIAVAATRSNDFAAGVIALQAAKSAPGLTAEQLAAMEQAAQAITSDLTRRADAGDPKAKAQLEAIERSRSQ
jgi:hypothetical protein